MEHVTTAVRGVIGGVRTVLSEARRQRLPLLAGSLAFYAFVSLIPLLVLLLVFVSRLAGDLFAAHVIELTRLYLSPNGQTLLAGTISDASGQLGGSILSVLALAWAASQIFWNLEVVFEQLYGSTGEKSTGRKLRDGAIGVVVLLIAALSVTTAGTMFAAVRADWLVFLNPLFLLTGLSIVFLPLYYFFPPIRVSPAEVVPGAIVAAGGWAVVEIGVQIYVATVPTLAAYGILGGVILLLLWLYFGALVTLVGVIVNVVLAGRLEESVPPAPDGVPKG